MSSRLMARAALAACLSIVASAAQAVVTYNGTNGVRNKIFTSNSVFACTNCHNSAFAAGSANRYGAPAGVNFDNYAEASANGDNANFYVANGYMPYSSTAKTAIVPLNATEKSLLQGWIDGGLVQSAAPTLTTNSATPSKFGATLSATVTENGTDNEFTFKYSTSSATIAMGSGTSPASPAHATDGNSGGGNAAFAVTQAISGLQCGTTYYYAVHGGGGQGGTQSFVTTESGCERLTTNYTSYALNENQSWTSLNAVSIGEGVNPGSVTYSLSGTPSVPTGMTINATTGVVTWASLPQNLAPGVHNYTVTITATGSGGNTATDSFTVEFTAINAPPTLAIPDTSATKGAAFSYNLGSYLSDEDDSNNGSNITWTLVSAPSWITGISSTGTVSGTPGDTALATETIEVRVEDGNEDGSTPPTYSFNISVSGTNAAPALAAITNRNVNEDATLTITASVTDADDPNNCSGALTWTLSNEPDGMEVTCAGVVTWTPTQAALDDGARQANKTYSGITLTVSDGGENGALAASQDFNVTVVAVNGAPVVAAIPNKTTSASSLASFTATATDEDNAADTLTWSLSSAPKAPTVASLTGMSIVPTGATRGQIGWSGNASNVPGTWTITVTATDPQGTPLAGSTTFEFTIEDNDGDGYEDYSDNCPSTSAADLTDTDGDGDGNPCDADDDNDGLTDTVEAANGYDPLVAEDHTTLDKDGDGIVNLDEFTACGGDPSCTAISNDSTPPLITPVAVADVTATGYFTPVAVSASATDAPDGAIAPSIYSIDGKVSIGTTSPLQFRAGNHEVVWEAYDSAGNRGTATQSIKVKPLVTMGGSQVIGAGQTAYVPVRLIGEAPSYPVVVTFEASGATAGADYHVASTSVQFDSPDTLAFIAVDALGGAADRDLVLRLTGVTGDAELASASQITHRLRLTVLPAAPDARLQVSQSGDIRPLVYADDGSFLVDALVTDPNGDGTASCTEWLAPAFVIGAGGNSCQVVIDPAAVTPGVYTISVSVSDGDFIVRRSIDIALAGGNAPVLSGGDTDGDGIANNVETAVDANGNGLLDYLDVTGNDSPESIQLSLNAGSLSLMAMTDSGLRLAAGIFAVAAQSASQAGIQVYESQVTIDGTPVIDKENAAIGAIYDFAVNGLNTTSTVAHVVLPLPVVLLGSTQWRVLGANGKWQDFSGAGADQLSSAPRGDDGSCPPPQDAAYTPGLGAGDACVQLIITDGGPNDADGEVNGSVQVTGAPTVSRDEIAAAIPTESQGGGSADLWTLMLLALAMLVIRRKEQVQ